jgi:hypothetical protein
MTSAIGCTEFSLGTVSVFSTELGSIADGVLGPSQWEPAIANNPNILGPNTDWFVDNFKQNFHQPPDYVAAGSFAAGLVLTECIRRAASLDDEALRNAASDSEYVLRRVSHRLSHRITNGTSSAAHPLGRRPQSSAACEGSKHELRVSEGTTGMRVIAVASTRARMHEPGARL